MNIFSACGIFCDNPDVGDIIVTIFECCPKKSVSGPSTMNRVVQTGLSSSKLGNPKRDLDE